MIEYPIKPRHYKTTPRVMARHKPAVTSPHSPLSPYTTLLHISKEKYKPDKPSLISSQVGAITRLLLTIPYLDTENAYDLPYINTYMRLLDVLPKHTRHTILVNKSMRPTVESWLAEKNIVDRAQLVETVDHLHFSVWAEDAYAIVRDGSDGQHYFVEPFSFHRYGDSLVADILGASTDFNATQAPIYFQGGNILTGNDYFFIGIDYPAQTLKYVGDILKKPADEDHDSFVRRLYHEYLDIDREIFYIGSMTPHPNPELRLTKMFGDQWIELVHYGVGTSQPIFHIDMFISLAGINPTTGSQRVLVGDPSYAAKLIDMYLPDDALGPSFDDIACNLEKLGFEVTRNPLPYIYVDDMDDTAWSLDYIQRFIDEGINGAEAVKQHMLSNKLTHMPARTWYYATANNCLIEAISDGKSYTVWLPTYGHDTWDILSITDNINIQLWDDLGYKVIDLGDFHHFASQFGAAHCITKYLERQDP